MKKINFFNSRFHNSLNFDQHHLRKLPLPKLENQWKDIHKSKHKKFFFIYLYLHCKKFKEEKKKFFQKEIKVQKDMHERLFNNISFSFPQEKKALFPQKVKFFPLKSIRTKAISSYDDYVWTNKHNFFLKTNLQKTYEKQKEFLRSFKKKKENSSL